MKLKHLRSFLLLALFGLALGPEGARAGVEELEKHGELRFTVALSLGSGYYRQESSSSPDISETGVGLGVGAGFLVHRRASVRLRFSGESTAVYRDGRNRELTAIFAGPSVQWWAHDWAILELGYGSLSADQIVHTTRGELKVEEAQGQGWLFSLGVPLAQFDHHFYQLLLEAVSGEVDGDALTFYQVAWQWQWR